jgi:hypothetical protein
MKDPATGGRVFYTEQLIAGGGAAPPDKFLCWKSVPWCLAITAEKNRLYRRIILRTHPPSESLGPPLWRSQHVAARSGLPRA